MAEARSWIKMPFPIKAKEAMKERDQNPTEKSAEQRPARRFFDDLKIEFLIHELKDPIAVIETGARALLERSDKYGPLTDRQQRTLNRMLRSTQKTREMLYDLLEVGRSEAGFCACCHFAPVQVTCEVLMDVLETLYQRVPEDLRRSPEAGKLEVFLSGIGVRMVVNPTAVEAEMFQDERKFRQIVGNLIKNGLHHRKESLEIRIEKPAPDALCISLADDGPGVDPKHHQLIFQRYAQVNECAAVDRKGHGLGLAGALVLARCLGGEITIDSRKGRGATFRLTLPLVLDAASPDRP
jgi:signal transduction histidine kinase